jgi:hypothetical protein
MRFLWIRCLVVLLSLALVCGNAHAALHLDGAHPVAHPEEHTHGAGKTSPHHQHRHNSGLACCCDCSGCISAAYLAPELNVTPPEIPWQVHYDALTAFLSGRALVPEPGPPRPDTLS